MDLFKIFKRKKTIRIKDIFSNVLDEMWAVTFHFRPWDEYEGLKPKISKVGIVSAEVDTNGIYVKTSSDLRGYELYGYIDKMASSSNGWTGFFETEEKAKAAYNATMDAWSDRMLSSKFSDEKKGDLDERA